MMKNYIARPFRLVAPAILLFMALFLLSGCHRKTTPEPTAGPTPAPTWSATPTVTPSATSSNISPSPTPGTTEQATLAPSPESPEETKSTPVPLPTPTPTATPFPPGPPTKLGVFVGRNDPQLFDLLRTGNLAVVKTLEYDPNFVQEIKQIAPDVFLVARYAALSVPDFNNWDPIAEAHKFAQLILPIATEPRRLAAIDCWESYNEPVFSNETQMASYAQFEAERVRLLAEAGVASCIGNFSVGNPALELWPAFFPALQAAKSHGGYLALHEYSAPYMWSETNVQHQHNPEVRDEDEGWLTLRYRKIYRDYLQPAGLDIPLVITETGIDGVAPGFNEPGGWRKFIPLWRSLQDVRNTDFGFYMEQLAWYDAELQRDDYVIGAAIFILAGPGGWDSYEISGPWLDILEQYLSVHPPH